VDKTQTELQALREIVGELVARVERLERKLPTEAVAASPARPPETPVSPFGDVQPPTAVPPPPPPVVPVGEIPVQRAKPGRRDEADLESRIGIHWLNRIGITAVLVGVSYFLKYAFDNNWIGPSGRVVIGLLTGIAMLFWSERFRARGYQIFSHSLKAVGIGAMYLSLWAGFHLYNLIPAEVAFVAMLLVTASAATIAITEDAQILAWFALAGGFSTPILLSTGQNREFELFSYVVLLDLATIVTVARKPWRLLLVPSYLGTLLLYIVWYAEFYQRSQLMPTVIFSTVFFVMFAIAPVVARQPEGEGAPYAVVSLVLAFVNAGVYFLEVYAMFEEVDKQAMAWFALTLAAVFIFLSRQGLTHLADPESARQLRFLHLALAIGFITIAVPIRLDGHWITIGWFVEAGVLLWLGDRIPFTLFRGFAVGALVLGVFRLLALDNFRVSTLIFNSRMGTFSVAIMVLGATAWFGARGTDRVGRQGAAIALIALNLLALVALSHEVADYYARAMAAARPGYNTARFSPSVALDASNLRSIRLAEDFTYSALWMGYGALLMIVGFWRRSAFVRWQALVLIAATIVKVFIYDVSQLDRGYRILSFIVLGILLLAISFGYQRDWLALAGSRVESRGVRSGA
jgi:uncharacterized membrane protein